MFWKKDDDAGKPLKRIPKLFTQLYLLIICFSSFIPMRIDTSTVVNKGGLAFVRPSSRDGFFGETNDFYYLFACSILVYFITKIICKIYLEFKGINSKEYFKIAKKEDKE